MSKKHFVLVAALAVMVLMLAACSGATATTDSSGAGSATQASTQAGSENTAMPEATMASGGDAAAECVGVDTKALMTAGQTLYEGKCAGCHGAQGEGVGDFPALSANPDLTMEDAMSLVSSYLSVDAHPKTLAPEELSQVISYVRGSFGNTGTVICPDQITLP